MIENYRLKNKWKGKIIIICCHLLAAGDKAAVGTFLKHSKDHFVLLCTQKICLKISVFETVSSAIHELASSFNLKVWRTNRVW